VRRGEIVDHHLVVMEAQRKWIEAYIHWLSKRRYSTTFPNHPAGFARPIIREVRFYDISVATGASASVLGDLAPYNLKDNYLGKKFGFWFGLVRFALGLQKVPEIEGYTGFRTEHKKDMSVYVIGSKKDKWINGHMEML